jgi:hypothetical protein
MKISPAQKPDSIQEYIKWLQNKHNIEALPRLNQHYETVASHVKKTFLERPFWRELNDRRMKEYDELYRMSHDNYPLLGPDTIPEVVTKPFNSFLIKTYRKNVLDNARWPNAPLLDGTDSWLLPPNWFMGINDIVRTRFVVKYLDGVAFLAEKFQNLCTELQMGCQVSLEAREEGYYAAHLSLTCQFEIPKMNWDTENVTMTIEMQITSQLQDVIQTLLHKHYEERRQQIAPPDQKWQWNYRSDEFATNYLGHILHYLEGMIIEIRDRQKSAVPTILPQKLLQSSKEK